MNRRTFLKRAGLVAAAFAVAPAVTVSAARRTVVPPICPIVHQGKYFVPNPEWLNAPYEIGFMTRDGSYLKESFAFRFHTKEDGEAFLKRAAPLTQKDLIYKPGECQLRAQVQKKNLARLPD